MTYGTTAAGMLNGRNDRGDLITHAAQITPSPRQLAWQQLEFYAFIHFTVNTFTNKEWGNGTEDPAIFNPTAFDADQWVEVIKDGGMRAVILTAKHHDGFCLWPSAHTDHSVRHSPWRGGRGDVVGEVAEACRRGGLKFGIYLSPWDRHAPTYGDSPRYNAYFRAQLRELLTNYGDIFAVWFDGACGEGPNGKRQVYDWESYYAVVRELQPGATIHVCGPDVRWCGNEAGHTRPSEWSVVPAELLDREKIAEKSQHADTPEFRLRIDSRDEDLGSRERLWEITQRRQAAGDREVDHSGWGLVWYPAEVNTSIRPGWFYHPEEDDQVKSLEELLNVYFGSVGGNATFLLNLPPDRRGLIHEHDAARVRELGRVLRETFAQDLAAGAEVTLVAQGTPTGGAPETEAAGAETFDPAHIADGHPETYWTTAPGQEQATLELTLSKARTFNVAVLQEQIAVGQRIERVRLTALVEGTWQPIAATTTVGYKRLLRFPPMTAQHVRVHIDAARLVPTLNHVGLYYNPEVGT